MPRNIPASQEISITGSTTFRAACLLITRRDGVEKGFTGHHDDLVVGGVTYSGVAGYTPTAIETTSNLETANLTIGGALKVTGIARADLYKGLYDHAKVEIFEVDYLDPATMEKVDDISLADRIIFLTGWLGEGRWNDWEFEMDLLGLESVLEQEIGQVYKKTCRAELGDAACGVDIETEWKNEGVVVSSANQRSLVATVTSLADPVKAIGVNDWFTQGVLTFTSGNNDGMIRRVKEHFYDEGENQHTLVFYESVPSAIVASDEFDLITGCRKRFTEDCREKFDNGNRFRGEPFVPLKDEVLRVAGEDRLNEGAG
jgi:uncharacterized phage protein (TIGR02218 family)